MLKITKIKKRQKVYDISVKDNANFFANGMLVHNCTEIFLPTRASKQFSSDIVTDLERTAFKTVTTCETGEVALCNLSSINIMNWIEKTASEKTALIKNLLRASDNLLDMQFYPVKDGELSNKLRRPIGIGVSNYAQYLAANKAKFTDKKARKLTHELFEDISYYILTQSMELAKERGAYHYFAESNWAKGILPMDLYKRKDDPDFNFPLKHDWETLRDNIKQFGVRFSYHMAIAPTATSSLTINATEGVEPTKKLFQMKEGTYTLPILAPNLRKHRMHYQNAFTIPTDIINDLASIRQKFLDQGQSVSHYYEVTDSAFEIITDIMHAEKVGMKSMYYLQPMKAGDIIGCESCSS